MCLLTPRKIFLFGLCIIAVIFLVSLVFPSGGWKIGQQTFYFPDYRTWFRPTSSGYKNIQTIIASVDTADYDIGLPDSINPDTLVVNDSLHSNIDSVQTVFPSIDSVYTYTYPFEFPEGRDSLFDPFFRTVKTSNKRDRPIRILHYGDSQIEGDRITSTIRNYMQKTFGGMGIGLIPIVPATDASLTFQQDISAGWTRFSVIDKKNDTLVSNHSFGIAGNFARYRSSGSSDTVAHIGLKPFYFGYRNARSFTHVRLFYGKQPIPFTVVVNQSETQRLPACDVVSSGWWRFEKKQTSFHLSLHAAVLPDLYGITLDGANGVAVDNIPLRGSSGLDFTRMNAEQMKEMFRMLNVKMLILQFGANVVPNIVDKYDYYARKLSQQIHYLKSLKPDLVIVVVGVNDMSRNSPEGYRSYPNIVRIRDAQRRAAFDSGCVFWDLFEAMGGENSMPSWVLAEPPLAQKDFVHFSPGGAKIIAELFCRAWEREYLRFLKRSDIQDRQIVR